MRLKLWGQFAAILAGAAVLTAVVLPPTHKTFFKAVPAVGEWLASSKVNLGLDLQGGTHLDYKINLAGVPPAQQDAITAGVRGVIEQRVNGLGVAEPIIFESAVGDERHLVVELAGIKDIEEAKKIVGKTIQLEFKEQQTEADPAEVKMLTDKAGQFLVAVRAQPAKFEDLYDDYSVPGKTKLEVDSDWRWASDLPSELQPVAKLPVGTVEDNVIEISELKTDESKPASKDGMPAFKQVTTGYAVARLTASEMADHEIKTEEKRQASHVLVAFKGAERAADGITRTEDEAKKRAEEVLAKLQAGSDIGKLADEYSDDPSAKQNHGDLGAFARGQMVPAFEDAVYDLKTPAIVGRVVRSPFGYHVIKLVKIEKGSSTTKKEQRVKLAVARFSVAPDGWKATGLTGQHFRRADVTSDPTTLQPVVEIAFTQVAQADTQLNGWQMVWYLVALAAGIVAFAYALGLLLGSTTARRDWLVFGAAILVLAGAIYGIRQTAPKPAAAKEAAIETKTNAGDKAGVDLFAELTKRNVGKPVAIFLDGLPIIDTNRDGKIDATDPAYAPRVQGEITTGQAVITGLSSFAEARALAQNLNTGAIPAPIRLSGQFTVGATLGEVALSDSLRAGAAGILVVALFMILVYRLPGLLASFALAIYGVILVFLIQFFGITLTLAGVAGVLLSIGMAVDANILIFERMKEELRVGKTLRSALDDGFERAWLAIRDGNVSTLIICAILFWFGSSIVKGFALLLAIGVLVSVFTAVTISRVFLHICAARGSHAGWLWGK